MLAVLLGAEVDAVTGRGGGITDAGFQKKKRVIRTTIEINRPDKNDVIDVLAQFALICRDIFCGVVPMGAENRAWRQKTGRLCQYLSREAEQVSRIFCGLEQRMK